jgi:hypothetical protein
MGTGSSRGVGSGTHWTRKERGVGASSGVRTDVWVGLLPIANNILTAGLALAGYRFRRVLVPIFLGNVTFPTGVAHLASTGMELFT